jgi:hypothetical protein
MDNKRQCGAGTTMGWYLLEDGRVRVEVECPLVAAPGALAIMARDLRAMAQAQDPQGLATADMVNAIAAEMAAGIKKQWEG